MQFFDLELKQYFWRNKRLIDAFFVCVLFIDRAMYIKCILLLYIIKKERQCFFWMKKERQRFFIQKKRDEVLVQSQLIYSYDVFLFYFTWNETKEEEKKNWIWEEWARWRVRVINKKYVPRARNEERKKNNTRKEYPWQYRIFTHSISLSFITMCPRCAWTTRLKIKWNSIIKWLFRSLYTAK